MLENLLSHLVEIKMPDNEDLNELLNYELLVLLSVLLHSSYQFVILRSVSESLAMQGSSWITRKKDDKSREDSELDSRKPWISGAS